MTNLKKIFFCGLVVSSSCIFGSEQDKFEKKDTSSASSSTSATRARAKSSVPKYSTQVVRIDMKANESADKTVGTTSSCTTCLTHESRIGELERQVANLAAMVSGFSTKQKAI